MKEKILIEFSDFDRYGDKFKPKGFLARKREEIIANWEYSGLLEGLTFGKKKNIARMLESAPSCRLDDIN